MSDRSWARRLLTAVLVGAVFFFLGREIHRNAGQLRSFAWEIRPALLLLSVLALALVLLWGVAVWRMLLGHFGARVSFRALARAWFLANLSRYVPGVVWQFVSLAQLGPSVGLSPAAMVSTLLVQMGFLLLGAAVVGVYLLPSALAGELAGVLEILRWVAPLALLAVHPRVIRTGLAVFARLTRRPALEWGGSWGEGVGILALSAASWLLYGAAFHLFLVAFVPLPLSALPAVVAVNALAFIVGYLAFFAPGGIGFKEGALTLLLSGLVPGAVAASLAIASRLWTIAGEVLPAMLLAWRRREATGEEASGPR
jgi:uncharacterized membrane protein YbhN (UPF0104 family)